MEISQNCNQESNSTKMRISQNCNQESNSTKMRISQNSSLTRLRIMHQNKRKLNLPKLNESIKKQR